MKSRDEVEALKANWRDDPCYLLETAEGLEEHHHEPLAYRQEMELLWEVRARERMLKRAEEVGVPRNLKLVAYLAEESESSVSNDYSPRSTVTSIRVAPASIAFSSSSLTTLAGRSTTSPAAIWLMTAGDRRRMIPMALPPEGLNPRLYHPGFCTEIQIETGGRSYGRHGT